MNALNRTEKAESRTIDKLGGSRHGRVTQTLGEPREACTILANLGMQYNKQPSCAGGRLELIGNKTSLGHLVEPQFMGTLRGH